MPSKKRDVASQEEEALQGSSTWPPFRRSSRTKIKPQPYWNLKIATYDHNNSLIGVQGGVDDDDPFADPVYTPPNYDLKMTEAPKQKRIKNNSVVQPKEENDADEDRRSSESIV